MIRTIAIAASLVGCGHAPSPTPAAPPARCPVVHELVRVAGPTKRVDCIAEAYPPEPGPVGDLEIDRAAREAHRLALLRWARFWSAACAKESR